jgi:putative colanic acid biosynthesis acetyltransferase WcaF
MPRPADLRAVQPGSDPYTRPSFSLGNRALRLLWNTCWLVLFRISPRPFHPWRVLLLRLFGAKLGPRCHIYPAAKVWAPWNLVCADHVCLGDGAEIYNPAPVHLGSHVILSPYSYLCGATHDYNDPEFPLLAYAMTVERHAWICARAAVAPGVRVGEGAVLGLQSVATHDLAPWTVYSGHPAVALRTRAPQHDRSTESAT